MKRIVLYYFLSLNLFALAQVGIGTVSPAASAILDITSTNKGLLPPRMTETEKNSISTPVDGLIVYQTNGSSGLYCYSGDEWRQFASHPSSPASIASLDFANAKLEPNTFTQNTPYTGVLKIPYTGGNGGVFAGGGNSTIASTGVIGLGARLQAGVLNYGYGE